VGNACDVSTVPPEDVPDRALGATFKRLRDEAGLSQEDLASRAEITMNSYGRIERIEVNPTWTTVRRIAESLQVSLAELSQAVEDVEG
jgi:XRE family transcriptional regulator, regulator of sulfur utilization